MKLISDSILVGFKAGAGLTIAMTQLPSLFGVAGGGHNFFERFWLFAGQLGQTQLLVLAVGVVAIVLLVLGERLLPGGRSRSPSSHWRSSPRRCSVCRRSACRSPGKIPSGCRPWRGPALRLRDVEGIVPLAAGCLLLAYIEGVSAARTFAAKHGYALDPRQEFLGIGAANLAAALGQAIPWPEDYRNRPSTTRRVRARRSRSCSLRSPCAVPAVSHRHAGKPAEGRTRRPWC